MAVAASFECSYRGGKAEMSGLLLRAQSLVSKPMISPTTAAITGRRSPSDAAAIAASASSSGAHS
jgi:hypothetical protein